MDRAKVTCEKQEKAAKKVEILRLKANAALAAKKAEEAAAKAQKDNTTAELKRNMDKMQKQMAGK
jgi:hypothetical protein